jgi:hypothetical protein
MGYYYMYNMRRLKIDQFTLLLSLVLIFCAGILIFAFRGIFNAISISYDTEGADVSAVKIQEAKFEEAKNFAFGQKKIVPLNIKPNIVPIVSVTVTPKPTPK